MPEQPDFGGSLRFRIWVTRGCYFTAADRFKRLERYSVGATTLLSFYVFVLSLVVLVFPDKVSQASSRWLTAGSLVISIFIIIITLMENSKSYALKAEYAGQTARELAFLFNQQDEDDSGPDDKAMVRRYNEILSQARVQHAMVDYHGFQLANPANFAYSHSKWAKTFAFWIIENGIEYWIYALMALGPVVPIIKIISSIFNGYA